MSLTRYYAKAYVITSTSAVFYGNEVTFVTPPIYEYTGTVQTFTVPAGVTALRFEAWGAQGGAGESYAGGNGGYVAGRLNNVVEGKVYYIYVGQKGLDNDNSMKNAFNGGGYSMGGAGGGGGASDVRTTLGDLDTRIIVAGGGGGAGNQTTGRGGDGGYPNGTAGAATAYGPAGGGGAGGTQFAGGAGGAGKTNEHVGIPGQKGIGGDAGWVRSWVGFSGGGGGADEAYMQNNIYGGRGGSGGGGSSYFGTLTSPSYSAGSRA